MRRPTRNIVRCLLPLLTCASACSLGNRSQRDRCVVNADCNAGRHCDQGYCAAGAPTLPRFSLMSAPGSSTEFGDVLIGGSTEQTFILSNVGEIARPITVAFAANADSGFSVRAGQPEDCGTATLTLASSTSCKIRVNLTPASVGARTATLGVDGLAEGAPAPLALSGNGQGPASLIGSTTKSFGNIEVGASSAPWTWTVTNRGDVDAPAPMLDNTNPLELVVLQNGCTASVPTGKSCDVTVAFHPSSGGARSGVLTLSASAGGAVTLTASANGQFRITVSRTGTGSGTVVSVPDGLQCGDSCSFLTDPGTVTLQARTINGANSFFSGWSGGGCSGPFRDCVMNLSAPTSVVATFSAMTSNLIFVTSQAFSTDGKSISFYDDTCNATASAAGINDNTGSAYVAHLSDQGGARPRRTATRVVIAWLANVRIAPHRSMETPATATVPARFRQMLGVIPDRSTRATAAPVRPTSRERLAMTLAW